MDMCNMCMHKPYCPMAMGMHQMPMNMNLDTDMDKMKNMGLIKDMYLDDMMDISRNNFSSNENTEDMVNNADFTPSDNLNLDDLEFTRRPKDHCHCNIENVLRNMERRNPGIFRRLTMCGMSPMQARRFVGRIVLLSLEYCND